MKIYNGNKGVISGIYGDNDTYSVNIIDSCDMPVIKSGPLKGQRPDIILNPLGVPNRLNPSQQFEQEFNFISLYIRNKIKTSKSREEKEYWYFDFIKSINIRQYHFTREFYNKLSDEDKDEFLKECEEVIYIPQEPFFNDTNLQLLEDLYAKYDFVKPFEFEGINIPLVMREMYVMRLKHDPIGKLSARSTGFQNLKNAPSKDKAYKYKKRHISGTPCRVGEHSYCRL